MRQPAVEQVRLEIIGIGEEEQIVELEELVDAGREAAAEEELQQVHHQERGHGAARIDLRPFINPLIPGPIQGPPPVDAEGWSQIDTWDTWMCAATCSQLLEDVPAAYRKAWSSALSTILRRVNQALIGGDANQVNRALKWLLLLPKLLFAQTKQRRAKRSGLWRNLLQI